MKSNEIIGQFEIFKYKAQESLCDWLNRELPILKANWWQSCVLNKLTETQRQTVQQNNVTTITGLDFAQLLKILDGNWYDLSQNHRLSRVDKTHITKLQDSRNRWSHKTTDEIIQNPIGINYDDLLTDIDTIWRFMKLFDTTQSETLEEIQVYKRIIGQIMGFIDTEPPPPPPPPPDDLIQNEIRKVNKRVRRWAINQQQINAKILTLFLNLERVGTNNITQQMLLQAYNNQAEFNRNFQQMKEITPNNHGKVFDVENDVVKIWEPVQDVVNEYKRIVFQQI